MEPLLASGDRILINVSQQVPVPPGIFVIWDGMGLVTKRIEHVPNSEPPKVVIKSVNPEYASYERLAEEVRIVGRAVWVARRLSDTRRTEGRPRGSDSPADGVIHARRRGLGTFSWAQARLTPARTYGWYAGRERAGRRHRYGVPRCVIVFEHRSFRLRTKT